MQHIYLFNICLFYYHNQINKQIVNELSRNDYKVDKHDNSVGTISMVLRVKKTKFGFKNCVYMICREPKTSTERTTIMGRRASDSDMIWLQWPNEA